MRNKSLYNPREFICHIIILLVNLFLLFCLISYISNTKLGEYIRKEWCMRTYHDYEYCREMYGGVNETK